MTLSNQKQNPLPVRVVENRRALDQLQQSITSFRQRYGIAPSVMYVGAEIFARAFPYQVFPKASAIGSTLVLQKLELDKYAVVMMKPPELKNGDAA